MKTELLRNCKKVKVESGLDLREAIVDASKVKLYTDKFCRVRTNIKVHTEV